MEASDQDLFPPAEEILRRAISIKEEQPQTPPLIYEILH